MKRSIFALASLLILLTAAAAPRYLESLRIGGGYDDPVDGGLDLDGDGVLRASGNAVIGEPAGTHELAVRSGVDLDASLHVLEGAGDDGGSLYYAGGADALRLGTVNGGNLTPALEIGQGSADVALLGGLTVDGNLALTADTNQAFDLYYPAAGANQNLGLTFSMNDNDGNKVEYGRISGVIVGSSPGGVSGKFLLRMTREGTLTAAQIEVDHNGSVTADGSGYFRAGTVEAGSYSETRGVITAIAGDSAAPGVLKLQSANGSNWYLFVEDDGTLRVHNALPTANSDGEVIGLQF